MTSLILFMRLLVTYEPKITRHWCSRSSWGLLNCPPMFSKGATGENHINGRGGGHRWILHKRWRATIWGKRTLGQRTTWRKQGQKESKARRGFKKYFSVVFSKSTMGRAFALNMLNSSSIHRISCVMFLWLCSSKHRDLSMS